MILSRFELLTFRLGGGRSIQLSYRITHKLNDNIHFFRQLGKMSGDDTRVLTGCESLMNETLLTMVIILFSVFPFLADRNCIFLKSFASLQCLSIV